MALDVDLPHVGERPAFFKNAVRRLQEHHPEPAARRMIRKQDVQVEHLAGDLLVLELEPVNRDLGVPQRVLPAQPPSFEGHSRRLNFSLTALGSSRRMALRASKPSNGSVNYAVNRLKLFPRNGHLLEDITHNRRSKQLSSRSQVV